MSSNQVVMMMTSDEDASLLPVEARGQAKGNDVVTRPSHASQGPLWCCFMHVDGQHRSSVKQPGERRAVHFACSRV